MKFISSIQWFENGDHPDDNCETFVGSDGLPFKGEGKVVRYFRDPAIRGEFICPKCRIAVNEHGWIDDRVSDPAHALSKLAVCPGDYVITLENSVGTVLVTVCNEDVYGMLVAPMWDPNYDPTPTP